MIPASFEYVRPKAIAEAIALLQQHGDEAKILSGGQSLIPMMKLRLARPTYLVDINTILGLHYIKEEGGYLRIRIAQPKMNVTRRRSSRNLKMLPVWTRVTA